jgi:signal transduction histidine kinase
MRLSQFIRSNMEAILAEWNMFAHSFLPTAKAMNQTELRSAARQILEEIAADMETAQTRQQQQAKSRGQRKGRAELTGDAAATSHGAGRLEHGFSLEEMVAEYRALRASVVRLWTQEMHEADREMLDELTRFNEAMDEALAASVGRFAQGIGRSRALVIAALGHDLRSPLSAIVNSAHLLSRTKDMKARDAQAVSRILTSANRMKQMVSDLLDFTRTRLGETLPIEPVPMDLGEACRAAIDEIGAGYPDATLRFEAHGNLSGNWDVGRIGQLLSNLIGNAVQHGRKGAPITMVARDQKDRVILTVHNEGQPIPEDQLPRIFQPLVRAPSQRADSGGLGLGLYISREIARAHRGTIEVGSASGAGTTITVCLPRPL